MKHEITELMKWGQITTGVPAALHETALSRQIGNRIAQMQGLETGVLAPSTLHLYWDLYGMLINKDVTIFVDEKVYPVSKYGIERLMVTGRSINLFKHLNANHLRENIRRKLRRNTTPIVITDGWCPQCGKAAPLQEYIELVSPLAGKVIIDDTQAFGVLEEKKYKGTYGVCGGGILKWLGIQSPFVVTIVSLAKGFGVPVAVISGKNSFVREFIEKSETRINSSPPSLAHLMAAMNALKINHLSGEERRMNLLMNVLTFKQVMKNLGLGLTGGMFPVQSINNLNYATSIKLYEKLKGDQIRTVLVSGHFNSRPALCFILRSNHMAADFEELFCSIKNAPN
jgi:8-amino-7-oxononanoate synthase